MSRLFGTDGVRGEANTELPPELAYKMDAPICSTALSSAKPNDMIKFLSPRNSAGFLLR